MYYFIYTFIDNKYNNNKIRLSLPKFNINNNI